MKTRNGPNAIKDALSAFLNHTLGLHRVRNMPPSRRGLQTAQSTPAWNDARPLK